MTLDFQVGKSVGQAESGFTKQAYVVKYLIRVGRSKMPPKHLTSYVNAPYVCQSSQYVQNELYTSKLTVSSDIVIIKKLEFEHFYLLNSIAPLLKCFLFFLITTFITEI